MPPPPPPIDPPVGPPLPHEIDDAFHQLAGAVLAIIGVSITVLGLHGTKVHGNDGSIWYRCNKSRLWLGYVLLWAFGQMIQLLAVKLASEPTIGAVSNFAILANLILANKMLGEEITRTDVYATFLMVLGSCLVVGFTPDPPFQSLSVSQVGHLFTSSPLAGIGLAGTSLVALAVLPTVIRSALRPHLYSGPAGGMAFGIMAGYMGGTSITMTKICWLIFDHYGFFALTLPSAWGISVVAFAGEFFMVCALFNGMAYFEATVVISTYYITLTLFSSLQGLCTFRLLLWLTAGSAVGFSIGVVLCIAAVCWSSWIRLQGERRATTRSIIRSQLLDGSAQDVATQSDLPSQGTGLPAAPPNTGTLASAGAPLQAPSTRHTT